VVVAQELLGQEVQAPEPWIQEDPASRAYASAREALNTRRYQEAAAAYARLRENFPSSGYVADSYYYQAFALYRLGSRSNLREARRLLETQMQGHPSASTLEDARALMIRVDSEMARQGDAAAAAVIAQQASDPCGPDQEVRVAALQALLNMNAERALPILREVLQDKDECSAELREQAVFLIAQKTGADAVDILLDLAHRNPDPDPGVVEQAVFWLSQVQSEQALGALEEILRDNEDPDIQEAALFAISQHRSERSGQILRDYVQRSDVSPELRENAIFWIGQSPGGAEYVKSIWATIDDPELKGGILHAVAQRENEENRQWLMDRVMDRSEDMEIRQNALFWAGQSGTFSVQELRDLFDSLDDPEMKEQVIFVASQRSGPESADFLMEVAENAENGEIREQAIFWLGQSDDPRVPEFLLRIIGR
jgi:HEAT repeat protein